MGSDVRTITFRYGLPEDLPSGTYSWRFHYDSAAKVLMEPLIGLTNAFIDAAEAIIGLDIIGLRGEDVAEGEKIPPNGYKLWWTDNPAIVVIPNAHYDLVLTFKVSSPLAITTLIALAAIVLIAYLVWQIVSTILEKVPPAVVGLGALGFLLIAVAALAPKPPKRERR